MATATAIEAYPLNWPEHWPRTPASKRQGGNQFGAYRTVQGHGGSWRSKARVTPDAARRSLQEELKRLGAVGVIISSNVPLRQDGEMRADHADRKHEDPGIAVYFTYKGKPQVMAQDAFDNIAANMRSLALAIEAMRALERHGGGRMMERAFQGFSALPPPADHKPRRPWHEVLRYPADPAERELLSLPEVEARLKVLQKKYHPDNQDSGDHDLFLELEPAMEDARKELGGGAEA